MGGHALADPAAHLRARVSLDPTDDRVFARAAAADRPVCGLTFRSTAEEIDAHPQVLAKEQIVAAAAGKSIQTAIAAGVKIAVGTDAPVHPHGMNLRELELFVEHGMTPAQALHAATGSAAGLLGVQDTLGTLGPGNAPTSSSPTATRWT
jgi:imidazolonepropionase-like amidohydrolase